MHDTQPTFTRQKLTINAPLFQSRYLQCNIEQPTVLKPWPRTGLLSNKSNISWLKFITAKTVDAQTMSQESGRNRLIDTDLAIPLVY